MTMDGAIERLMRILYDYCLCPPPPEIPGYIYGLSPPNSRPSKLIPTINPLSYDKHAAYRFSLALQSIVNIGIRGSEPIRSRIVQAGALEVVGCILESWLAHKGFAIGPSSSASGLPRESREHRLARRAALQEQRQREEATQLHRALQRQIAADAANRTDFITSRIDSIQDVCLCVICHLLTDPLSGCNNGGYRYRTFLFEYFCASGPNTCPRPSTSSYTRTTLLYPSLLIIIS